MDGEDRRADKGVSQVSSGSTNKLGGDGRMGLKCLQQLCHGARSVGDSTDLNGVAFTRTDQASDSEFQG